MYISVPALTHMQSHARISLTTRPVPVSMYVCIYVRLEYTHTYIPDAHKNKIQNKKQHLTSLSISVAFLPDSKIWQPKATIIDNNNNDKYVHTVTRRASCIIIPTSK